MKHKIHRDLAASPYSHLLLSLVLMGVDSKMTLVTQNSDMEKPGGSGL